MIAEELIASITDDVVESKVVPVEAKRLRNYVFCFCELMGEFVIKAVDAFHVYFIIRGYCWGPARRDLGINHLIPLISVV